MKLLIAAILLLNYSVLAFDYSDEKKFDLPLREASVIITKEGYYPKSMAFFEGEKVRFFVTSTLPDPSCFMIQEKGVFLSATNGKISEAEAYFDRPGEYRFYCSAGNISGKIVVLKKKNPVAERDVASEKKSKPVKVWKPRD